MSSRERQKGLRGEAEVAAVYRAAGLTVRGLEGGGDHLVVCGPNGELALHSEVKRQETARPWVWWGQASAEAPEGASPVVAFRRSRSPWLAMLLLADLAELARFGVRGCHIAELVRLGNELAEISDMVAITANRELGTRAERAVADWDAAAAKAAPELQARGASAD